jgi:hypothetical protein
VIEDCLEDLGKLLIANRSKKRDVLNKIIAGKKNEEIYER